MSEIGKKYMVTFDIPVFLEDNIEYILDNQKKALDAYFYQGKIFHAPCPRTSVACG